MKVSCPSLEPGRMENTRGLSCSDSQAESSKAAPRGRESVVQAFHVSSRKVTHIECLWFSVYKIGAITSTDPVDGCHHVCGFFFLKYFQNPIFLKSDQ